MPGLRKTFYQIAENRARPATDSTGSSYRVSDLRLPRVAKASAPQGASRTFADCSRDTASGMAFVVAHSALRRPLLASAVGGEGVDDEDADGDVCEGPDWIEGHPPDRADGEDTTRDDADPSADLRPHQHAEGAED